MKPECDDKHWKDACSAASKTRHQSPIALSVKGPQKFDMMAKSGLKFNGAYKTDQPKFYIIDTGHSLQIQLNEEPTSELEIEGVDGSSYRLAQVSPFLKSGEEFVAKFTNSKMNFSSISTGV